MRIPSAWSLGLILVISASCGNNQQYPQENNRVSVSPVSNNVNIQADAGNAAFDVNKLSGIVQKSTDPKVLEEKINDPSTEINNLDLDKDGKVDYLTVTEQNGDQLVVSDAAVDPAVTVATMTITPNKETQTASMQIVGEPAYCGAYNTYYRPSISFGEILFLSYLMAPHAYYHPYYGYGHYPGYYTSHRTVVRTVYRTSSSSYMSSRPSRSYNSGGSGFRSSSRSELSNPTRSQRSFGQRDASRSVGSGGFGNRSSAPSRSSSGFGGGSRRSFGGGRRR